MISDHRPHIRQLAWRRIQEASKITTKSPDNVCKFCLPELNLECDNYIDLINWQKVVITEPPLTMDLSDETIISNIQNKVVYKSVKYPVHTQAVERVIKLVTEASAEVCSHEAREGLIRSRLSSRKRIPFFNSKKDYVSKLCT